MPYSSTYIITQQCYITTLVFFIMKRCLSHFSHFVTRLTFCPLPSSYVTRPRLMMVHVWRGVHATGERSLKYEHVQHSHSVIYRFNASHTTCCLRLWKSLIQLFRCTYFSTKVTMICSFELLNNKTKIEKPLELMYQNALNSLKKKLNGGKREHTQMFLARFLQSFRNCLRR